MSTTAGSAGAEHQTTQHPEIPPTVGPPAGDLLQHEMQVADADSSKNPTSHGSPQTPTQLSESSSSGSITPKASGSTELNAEFLIQKLHDLRIAGGHDSDPNGSVRVSPILERVTHSQGQPAAMKYVDSYEVEEQIGDSEDDEEVLENQDWDRHIQARDNDPHPELSAWKRIKMADIDPLPCVYSDDDFNARNIKTLFDLLRVSIPKIPEAYDSDALQETKSVSKGELKLPEEAQLRKIVFLPGLVSQLFDKAIRILQKITIDWNDPKVNRFLAKVHPAFTSTCLPETTWSEQDVVTWSGTVIGRPSLEAIHAILAGGLVKRDLRRKYPNIASCHHKDPVVPDMAVIRQGKHSNTVKLVATIEVKTQSAYQVGNTAKGKFDDLQTLESADQIGKAMKYVWPEKSSEKDTQARMLAQVWAQMVYKGTQLGELTTVENTTYMARGIGSQSDTMFISPAYGCNDCPLLAAFCWHAMATNLFTIKDLNLPQKVDTDWWGREVIQFEGTGVAPASLCTHKPRLTNREKALAS